MLSVVSNKGKEMTLAPKKIKQKLCRQKKLMTNQFYLPVYVYIAEINST